MNPRQGWTKDAYISGTPAGDVTLGVLIFIGMTILLSLAFTLPPFLAIPWLTIAGTAFVVLHVRTPVTSQGTGDCLRLRMRLVRYDVLGAAVTVLASLFLGLCAGGLVQLLTGPIASPLAPTEPNRATELLAVPGGWLVLGLLGAVVAPAVEEICFRGWIQQALERRWGPSRGILLSALLFAAAHVWYGALPLLLVPFVLGIVWGTAVYLTRSVWSGVFLHGVWNAALLTTVRLSPDPSYAIPMPASKVGVALTTVGFFTSVILLVWSLQRQARFQIRGKEGFAGVSP